MHGAYDIICRKKPLEWINTLVSNMSTRRNGTRAGRDNRTFLSVVRFYYSPGRELYLHINIYIHLDGLVGINYIFDAS